MSAVVKQRATLSIKTKLIIIGVLFLFSTLSIELFASYNASNTNKAINVIDLRQ